MVNGTYLYNKMEIKDNYENWINSRRVELGLIKDDHIFNIDIAKKIVINERDNHDRMNDGLIYDLLKELKEN
jgi:phage anti-repressor protein